MTRRPETPPYEVMRMLAPANSVRRELKIDQPTRRLADLVLDDETSSAWKRVLAEHAAADRLQQHGLQPTRTALLLGPPGCGKTATAEAIARELGLPLVRCDAGTLVRSHMGETGQRVTDTLRWGHELPAVWLFDEFDALAQRRTGGDEGISREAGRMVTALLLGLDAWAPAGGMLVAASNMDGLDHALLRRFDVVLRYAHPTPVHLARIARKAASGLGLDVRGVDWMEVESHVSELGPAEVESAVRRAATVAIVARREVLTTEDVAREMEALRARARAFALRE